LQPEIKQALDVLQTLLESDIYIIPLRLEACDVPKSLSLFQWVDYFREDGWERLIESIHKGMNRLGIIKPVRLRTYPLKNFDKRSIIAMMKKNDFFEYETNWTGEGIQHYYEVIDSHGHKLVIDHVTGLIWQQSFSELHVPYSEVNKYILNLNSQNFGGYSNWRLPTLEEAMLLMESRPKNINLFIDSVFDSQKWLFLDI